MALSLSLLPLPCIRFTCKDNNDHQHINESSNNQHLLQQRKLQRMKVPGQFTPGSECSRERQFQAANWPGSDWNFRSRERIGPGVKMLGTTQPIRWYIQRFYCWYITLRCDLDLDLWPLVVEAYRARSYRSRVGYTQCTHDAQTSLRDQHVYIACL